MVKAAKLTKPPKTFGRFRLMLADNDAFTPTRPEELETITYPVMGAIKKDGLRCGISPLPVALIEPGLFHDGSKWDVREEFRSFSALNGGPSIPMSRSLLQINNLHARALLSELPPGIDCEIGVVIDGVLDFRASTSAIMTGTNEVELRAFVFDNFLFSGGKWDRYMQLLAMRESLPAWAEVLEQRLLHNATEVLAMYAETRLTKDEGLILSSPDGPYKPNRSTRNEGYQLKVKQKERFEGICVGVEEEFENTNEKLKDERGLSKRSTHKANKIGKGIAGKLLVTCEGKWPGQIIKIGTGMTKKEKEDFFINPPLGEMILCEYHADGEYDAPRSASFIGIRHPDDLS